MIESCNLTWTQTTDAEWRLFNLSTEESFSEHLDDDVVVAEVTELPSAHLHGLWDSLTFDSSLKDDVSHATMPFHSSYHHHFHHYYKFYRYLYV